jgi:acyl-coenzyme A thioesterase PaaI-like protein
MSATDPLYHLDAGRFVPTAHTRGPWDPAAQHGGAPAALVARALEDVAGEAFLVTRITIELLRPVPLAPLTIEARVTKPGRRTLGAAVTVTADGVPVVDARGMAVRLAELPTGLPPELGRGVAAVGDDVPGLVAGPAEGRLSAFGLDAEPDEPAFHRTGVEVRSVGGGFDTAGPAQAWCRLQRPVVDAEAPSGLQRVAAAADFGNGLSWVLPFERWTFVNADLTIHLVRPAEGEWIGLDAVTYPSDRGTALAECVLYDDGGRLGRSAQSVIIERRVA